MPTSSSKMMGNRNISLKTYKSVRRMPYTGNCSWAYIAGFFDGEGSIMFNGPYGMRVSMAQKDPAVLREIQRFLLSAGIEASIYSSRKGCTLIFTNRYAIYRFIMKIQNHCFVKLDRLWDARAFLWEKISHARD